MRTIISILQAILFIVSSFAVQDSNFKFWVDRAAMALSSTSENSFSSINADEMAVSQEEKRRCREWYNNNILYADGSENEPAYNFTVGGKSLRRNTDDWDFSVSEESAVGAVHRGGKTSYITLKHKKSDIVATVEATIYEDSASCEWTVYIKNTGDGNSPVISNFYAADCTLPTGGRTQAYFSKGSEPAADDFELLKSRVSVIPMKYTANGGRTESFLPYFNLLGRKGGVVLAVGWSGQWFTSLSQTLSGVRVKAKQEQFKGYLVAAETVRSPLVTLTFYDSDNALKGFNGFRNFTMDCVYPEGTKQVATSGVGVEVPSTTMQDVLQNITNTPEEWTEMLDYYWIDAGWFPIKTDWGDSVGNWYADPARFPDGLGEAAKLAESRGVEFLVWYEPERCCVGTEVYNECIKHEGWLIENGQDRNLVNLANEQCLEYITQLMLDSIRYNGVKCFRIDSAITHLPYWQEADERWCDGRKGISENHYVTNFYKFLDTLLEEVSGLRIDNCCSGGKRLDIEMSRRGIPLWRSDYNCMDGEGNVKADIVEATQAQTYGISFWLPYNGTCAYVDGEYADRSNIISCSQRLSYFDIRQHMTGNYYPLTYGGLDTEKYLAMQFDTEAKEGMALIYKRENVKENTYTLKLNGLFSDAVYEVYNYDSSDVKYRNTGEQLMKNGLEISIEEAPKAVIILYEAVG